MYNLVLAFGSIIIVFALQFYVEQIIIDCKCLLIYVYFINASEQCLLTGVKKLSIIVPLYLQSNRHEHFFCT